MESFGLKDDSVLTAAGPGWAAVSRVMESRLADQKDKSMVARGGVLEYALPCTVRTCFVSSRHTRSGPLPVTLILTLCLYRPERQSQSYRERTRKEFACVKHVQAGKTRGGTSTAMVDAKQA
eukprot:366007-Chlamydomonas_euryale.AAC.11